MNKKVKKIGIIILSILVLLLVTLFSLPFLFKDKIIVLAKKQINLMVNGKVDFESVDLSFIRSFPNASVKFENLYIAGVNDFKNDTLLKTENIDLTLNIRSLFSDNGYEIKKLQFNNSKVFVHVLSNGLANWDIMKEDSTEIVDTTSSSFHFKLKDFVINNADIIYLDEEGNFSAFVQHLNHSTSGDLTADSSLLVTKTSIDSLSFWMEGMEYLSKAKIEFNADINANINEMIFKFSENSSKINALPFSFSGWVKLLDEGYDMDLKLNAEKVDFKAILSLIPAVYSTSFDDVKADGKVNLSGFVKGIMVNETYPAFDFSLSVVDGTFQYPSLPKSLQKINIAAHIFNTSETLDETVVDVSKFSFLMGGNPFSAELYLAHPMSDPEMKMKAVGKINLANIKEIYPLEANTELNGLLDMNLQAGGRKSYYDTNQYERFIFAGSLTISDMLFKMKSLPQDVSIKVANLKFNQQYAELNSLQMKIGRNDFSATGKLENMVAYALYDKTLSGTLSLQSNYLNISDFMSTANDQTDESKATKGTNATNDTTQNKVIIIPKNLNFTMQGDFKQLVYENMNFTNAKGLLTIADGDMTFKNMGVQAFGGNLLMNGVYSTTDPSKPVVDFNISINDVIFKEIAEQIETVQQYIPIFEKATGTFSTNLSFNSLIQSDMMPDLASMIGKGTFFTESIGLTNVPALNELGNKLKINEFKNTVLKDLGLKFAIKDGSLSTQPFDVKIGKVAMNLGGAIGMDKTLNYVGKVNLPDKLNLGKFSTVNLKIGGTFNQPKVSIDLASTLNAVVDEAKAKVKEEVTQQVDKAKEKALEEAKKQRELAVKAAEAQAEKIKNEAKKLGDQLVSEAQNKGNALVAKTNNPISKKMAEAASAKLVAEARQKANEINAKAESEASKMIQKASGDINL